MHPVIFTTLNHYSLVSSTNRPKWCFLNNRIMHRFLTGLKREADDEPTANSSSSCIPKPKSCKYDGSYLSFGFMSVIINSEE
jgi:hypothetical protein